MGIAGSVNDLLPLQQTCSLLAIRHSLSPFAVRYPPFARLLRILAIVPSSR
jgi:hypothetical protein